MPVLYNKESGLAENLSQSASAAALVAGTHEVPLVAADGSFGSASFNDAAELLREGYRQPNADELRKMLDKAKAETTYSPFLYGKPSGTTAMQIRKKLHPGTAAFGEFIGALIFTLVLIRLISFLQRKFWSSTAFKVSLLLYGLVMVFSVAFGTLSFGLIHATVLYGLATAFWLAVDLLRAANASVRANKNVKTEDASDSLKEIA